MRADLNKAMVERERRGSKMKFHEKRKMKIFNSVDEEGNPLGGREGIKTRYQVAYELKSFNENLTPLKGWLRTRVGKSWDKSYSELKNTFDSRSVINNHILEHLFQYVEIGAKLIDGKPMVLKKYGLKGYVPIAESWSEYYVCPKDGTLKVTKKLPRKSILRDAEVRKQREADAVFRVLDEEHHLHLINGTWFKFSIKELPEAVLKFVKPYGIELFGPSYLSQERRKPWDALSMAERERYGKKVVEAGNVYDAFLQKLVHRELGYGTVGVSRYGKNCSKPPKPDTHTYYDTKSTASHKDLKEAGVIDA